MRLTGRPCLAAALLVAAIALGGGYDPLREFIVEMLALVLLVVVLAHPLPTADRSTRAAYVLVGLIALLPLLQLIPLPPAIWHSLPGREIAVSISGVAGLSTIARPLSLDPDATWLSAAALLPPIAMFLATVQADADERRVLASIVVLGAVASVLLGFLQSPGGADVYLFRWADRSLPVGLFANRNHQAEFLVLGILLATALAVGRPAGSFAHILAIGCILLLALGVIVTRSRSGVVLMAAASVVCASIYFKSRSMRLIRLGAVVAILAVAAALLLTQNLVAHQVISRFADLDDLRPTIWRTSWIAAQQSWPVGTGFGTFVPVYQTHEQLDDLIYAYINHAHCDYLELLLEGGAAAIGLLVAYFVMIGNRIARRPPGPIATAAATAVVLVLLHSLVDYPLRMGAMATTFAMLNGFLFTPPRPQK